MLVVDDERFIPTPVGNASREVTKMIRAAVHPHARGERGVTKTDGVGLRGSSPRPWGTRIESMTDTASTRFIPTPVGNARKMSPLLHCSAVHPHARGERHQRSKGLNMADGSSPRPWGTLVTHTLANEIFRFIPTPVGNAYPR